MRPAWAPAAALALAVAVVLAPAASAHAYLASAEPGPDAHVELAPEEVRLRFTEELEHEVTEARVLALDGARMDAGQRFPAGEPTTLVVLLKPLPDGVYTVEWVTLSVDTHTARGSYVFAVGNATLEGAPPPTATHDHPAGAAAALEASGHALLFAGAALTAGIPLFALAIDRGESLADAVRGRRLLRAGAAAGLAGALGGAATLLAFSHRVDVPALTLATGTATGRWLLARTALLALAAAAVALQANRVLRARIALALGAAALAATSLSSHAAAMATGRTLAVASDLAHLCAAATWAGGLAALLLVLPGAGTARAAALVRRFSPWAIGSVALLGASGAYASVLHLQGWGDLVGTGYGRAILAKVALLLALVALGAVNLRLIGPRLAAGADRTRALRRSVQAEAALLAAVLAVTGLLTTLAPPESAAAPPPGPSPAFSKVLRSGHLVVTITPQPVAVGIQSFTVQLHPLGRPVPNGTEVYLKFQEPGQAEPEALVPMQPAGAGTWMLRGGHLTSRGAWTVHVIVQNLEEYAKPSFQVEVG